MHDISSDRGRRLIKEALTKKKDQILSPYPTEVRLSNGDLIDDILYEACNSMAKDSNEAE